MINKDNAEHYIWGGDCDGWHLAKSPDLSVIHERMPPGRAEVRHYHEHSRQLFFVLCGRLTMVLDERSETLEPGQALDLAPLTRHQASNLHSEPVEFLVISQPTTRGDRIDLP